MHIATKCPNLVAYIVQKQTYLAARCRAVLPIQTRALLSKSINTGGIGTLQ